MGIASLNDTLALITDRDAGEIYLANWQALSAVPIGKRGGGPGEYRSLGTPISNGAGLALVLDSRQRRVLGYSIANGWATVADVRLLPLGIRLVGADQKGQLYFEHRPVTHGRAEAALADSSLVLRLAIPSRLDTMAQLRAPQSLTATIRTHNSSGGEMVSSLMFDAPYQSVDAWAVRVDGALLLLRSLPPRLDVQTTSVVREGPQLQLPTEPLTSADRNDSLAPAPGVKLPPWPRTLPPFQAPARACGPDGGSLVVPQPAHHGDRAPGFFVLTPGQATYTGFRLADGERLVGCDAKWYYVVHTDSTGAESVARYFR